MTNYLKAPEIIRTPIVGTSIFLAGGISDCWDWQSPTAVTLIDSKSFNFVINPRREFYDMNDKTQTPIQIKWEYRMLKESTHIMFWFTSDTLQPITLFELGKSLGTDKKLYVGCDPNYARQLDVVEQLQLERPDIKVWNSLDGMLDFIISDNK